MTGPTVLLLLLLLSWPASAQTYPPAGSALTASTSEGSPGDLVTVSGSGYEPGTEVAITFGPTDQLLATVRTDESGSFTTAVRIPTDATPGEHMLKATGVGADGRVRVLSSRIFIRGTVVTAAPSTTSTSKPSPGDRVTVSGAGNQPGTVAPAATAGTGAVRPAAAPATPATPRGPLSLTGMANLWPMVATALVLLVFGCLLMVRRREA